jgi:hypothetical protein
VRIVVLGAVSATGLSVTVTGPQLGGRGIRVALVALALGGLRATLARVGAAGQRVIVTTPAVCSPRQQTHFYCRYSGTKSEFTVVGGLAGSRSGAPCEAPCHRAAR